LETGTLECYKPNSRYAQPGLPGSEMDAILELKVLADVGLVGFQMLENQHYCLF
jgi:GTPase involved in cell partitioning and DNA repair